MNPFRSQNEPGSLLGVGGFFATVVSTGPLMVQNETGGENHRAINLAGRVVPGDRVFVAIFGRRLVALGPSRMTTRYLEAADDLDDFRANGWYLQTSNAKTDLANNYPVERAGMLEVLDGSRDDGSEYMTYQRYTEYSNGNVWVRTYYVSWRSWKRLAREGELDAYAKTTDLSDYVPWERGNYQVSIGHTSSATLPSLFLRRQISGSPASLRMILTFDNPGTGRSAALRLHDGGSISSQFSFSDDGNMMMRTYGDSPTASGGRPIPFAMAAGVVDVTASNGLGYTTVTLPSGRFTTTPRFFVTGHSSVTSLTNVQFSSPSKSSVRIYMNRSTTATTSVHWLAVQMTSTSAGG